MPCESVFVFVGVEVFSGAPGIAQGAVGVLKAIRMGLLDDFLVSQQILLFQFMSHVVLAAGCWCWIGPKWLRKDF